MTHPVVNYLRRLYDIRMSGADQSGPDLRLPLANLLNDVGQTLKPKVRAVLNLKDIGASLPDGGLFTAAQFSKSSGAASALPASPPSRGAIELRSPETDLFEIAYSPRVERQLKKYGWVLVTNYRAFSLMGLDADNQPLEVESCILAETEQDFWDQAAQPAYAAQIYGDRLVEYLRRVMLHPVPLTAVADIAVFLASYARELQSRLENVTVLATDTLQATSLLQALDDIRLTLETTLKVSFDGEKGHRFFLLSLIQALFCSIFSAWILWHYEEPARQDKFDWKLSHWYLRLPLVYALFRALNRPAAQADAPELNLEDIFDRTGELLNRVDRAQFFSQFKAERTVREFYELFLQSFPPQFLKELGIWYTPPEIARYMVGRVDTILREELKIPAGLADEQVHLLDPCCGTGAYLVEALKQIAATLAQKDEALSGYYTKKAALKRIFGFEILPASFIMAHLQAALLLHALDMPLTATDRLGIHLTNALTGWSPVEKSIQPVAPALPELQAEQDAANAIKQNGKILVILGSPPPAYFPNLTMLQERDIASGYYSAESGSAPPELPDPYLCFFRLAERQIVEQNDRGLICYVSPYNWLDSAALTEMRQRYLNNFDLIWIDSLNGDKYKTGNLTPAGEPDPSVFATRFNREGAPGGTAVAVLVRRESHQAAGKIYFRSLWGQNKLSQLLALRGPDTALPYEVLTPGQDLPFLPLREQAAYLTWPSIAELFSVSLPVIKSDPKFSSVDATPFAGQQHLKYVFRPFDHRYSAWPPESQALDDKQADLATISQAGNSFLVCRKKAEINLEGPPLFMTSLPADRCLIQTGAASWPVTLKGQRSTQQSLFDQLPNRVTANLSATAYRYLLSLGIQDPEMDEETAALISHHLVAVGYSPAYLTENEGPLRQDWPRIPLPNSEMTIRSSAALGQKVAALLDPETPVYGVTTGPIRSELKSIGGLTHIENEYVNFETDLSLTAGWGYPGRGNTIAPGQGHLVERNYTPAERATIEKGAAGLGLSLDQLDHYLGLTTCDIYLNEVAYWANIPHKVWEYTIGGHQVIKSWLSCREEMILSRPLQREEAHALTNVARRIMALILMGPVLDANYRAVKQAAYPWPVTKYS